MTRKDYVLIAEALKESRPNPRGGTLDTDTGAALIADALATIDIS